ncbi:MAG: DUF192 domain-containing protein [Nanoarchaeota archaeon]
MKNQKNSLGKIIITILIFVIIILIIIVSYNFYVKKTQEVNSNEKLKACIDEKCFFVETADTYYKRIKGLMNREFLDEDKGMLFIFPNEDTWGFWMKDTLIPLDIIWADENMKITDIKEDLTPCKENPCQIYSPEAKAKYALEINSGLVNKLNITNSSKFKLNFFPS